MKKSNVAIVMGGFSSEAEISMKSGEAIYNTLIDSDYTPYKVLITPQKWVVSIDEKEYEINKHDFSFQLDNKKITFDVVFNAIHGSPGEDGALVGYFEMIGVKHTASSLHQMALTFNKKDCLSVVKQFGILTAESVFLEKGESIDLDNIIAKVGLPCFVKPNQAGSSLGISKVSEAINLDQAINKAFEEDDIVLIESFLEGTEVSVGVVTYRSKKIVLPITEILTTNDFFDYEAKYLGQSEEITPARISKEIENNVTVAALKIYDKLRLKGFSRSEFIIVGKMPYFLEINTIPGFTNESILPQQLEKQGIGLKNMVLDLIKNTL